MTSMDFQLVFECCSSRLAVLDENFVIRAATQSYLESVHRTKEDIIDKCVFEAFLNNTDGSVALRVALNSVISTAKNAALPSLRYDIIIDGKLEERWWQTDFTPVIKDGNVKFITIMVEDITELRSMVHALRQYKSNSLVELAKLTAKLKLP